MSGKRWTDKDTTFLRKFHAEGWDDQEIAYILQRASSTVWRRRQQLGLKSNGVPGPTAGTVRLSEEHKSRIRAYQLSRWQDEQYAANQLHKLRQACEQYQASRWRAPSKDTPEGRHYRKTRALLGAEKARADLGLAK